VEGSAIIASFIYAVVQDSRIYSHPILNTLGFLNGVIPMTLTITFPSVYGALLCLGIVRVYLSLRLPTVSILKQTVNEQSQLIPEEAEEEEIGAGPPRYYDSAGYQPSTRVMGAESLPYDE
jgi:hypothetical protein